MRCTTDVHLLVLHIPPQVRIPMARNFEHNNNNKINKMSVRVANETFRFQADSTGFSKWKRKMTMFAQQCRVRVIYVWHKLLFYD